MYINIVGNVALMDELINGENNDNTVTGLKTKPQLLLTLKAQSQSKSWPYPLIQ